MFTGVKSMDYDEAVKAGLIEILGDETDRRFMANVTSMINDKETVAKGVGTPPPSTAAATSWCRRLCGLWASSI